MPHVVLLCDVSQSRNTKSTSSQLALEIFYRMISAIRKKNKFTPIRKFRGMIANKKRKIRRKKIANIAKEVCETMCFRTKEQFKFLGQLSAAKLLVSEKISDFYNDFPLKE